jgi:hypothetical protein
LKTHLFIYFCFRSIILIMCVWCMVYIVYIMDRINMHLHFVLVFVCLISSSVCDSMCVIMSNKKFLSFFFLSFDCINALTNLFFNMIIGREWIMMLTTQWIVCTFSFFLHLKESLLCFLTYFLSIFLFCFVIVLSKLLLFLYILYILLLHWIYWRVYEFICFVYCGMYNEVA